MRQDLLADSSSYSLFQAVQIIEKVFDRDGQAGLDGEDADDRSLSLLPEQELVRFRGVVELGFPAADIARISVSSSPESGTEGSCEGGCTRYEIETACLGLYGPASPLPYYFSERIAARDRDAETLRDFLDLFNHRILSLLCGIARRYRHEYIYSDAADDEISALLSALSGGPQPNEMRATRLRHLRCATRLGLRGISASSLGQVISVSCGVPDVSVREFVLRRASIPSEQRIRLGERNGTLGQEALLGDHAMSAASKIRIRIGSLDSDDFEAFLTGRRKRGILERLLQAALPTRLAWDLVLVIAFGRTAFARLGERGRLATDAWLGPMGDTAEAVFAGEA